jgi:glycosyltransferase involved in cell wall biosynthesis
MFTLPISVIIPHYNRPDLLAEAVDSVLGQTRPPDEIIVVDDHSTPENQEKLRRLGSAVRIHYNSSNLGSPATRNAGAALASNRLLAFLDDDDLYHPWKLELQYAHLNRYPSCDVLGGPLWHVGPDGVGGVWGYQEDRQLNLRDALLHTASSLCTMLIPKEVYQRVGGMSAAYRHMSDLEFGIRILAAGCEMRILPEPLVTYRHGGREELSLNWHGTFAAHFRIIQKHRLLFQQEFGNLGAIQEFARRAQFYGLRKGRLVGRSLWAAGCIGQALFGSEVIEAATSSAGRRQTRKYPNATGRPTEDQRSFLRTARGANRLTAADQAVSAGRPE